MRNQNLNLQKLAAIINESKSIEAAFEKSIIQMLYMEGIMLVFTE